MLTPAQRTTDAHETGPRGGPTMAPRGGATATASQGGTGMGRTQDRRRDRQHARHYAKAGQALTEFALLLPILLLITMGVLDLGRAFHTHVALGNAARVGVAYAQQVYDPANQANCASGS